MKYYGSSWIETDEINSEIKKYLKIDLKNISIDKNKFTFEKFKKVTERLAFIDGLLKFRGVINKNKFVKNGKIDLVGDDNLGKFQTIYSCILFNHDYASVEYDIDALVTYLLITCLDILLGKVPYTDWGEFLIEKNKNNSLSNEQIEKFYLEYREDYGLYKNFINFFVIDLDKNLREKYLKSFVLAGIENGEIVEKKWNTKDDEKKIKEIAEFLYGKIRSSFTHEGNKFFSLNTEIIYLPDCRETLLLKVENEESNNLLNYILIETILYKVKGMCEKLDSDA